MSPGAAAGLHLDWTPAVEAHHDPQARRRRVPLPGRGDAGSGRPPGGHRGRLRPWRLAAAVLRRRDGQGCREGMAETDAYLFGRKTYQKMAAFWPTAPAADPFAAHLNGTTQVRRVADPCRAPRGSRPRGAHRRRPRCGSRPQGAAGRRPSPSSAAASWCGRCSTTTWSTSYGLTVSPLVLGSGKRLFGALGRRAPPGAGELGADLHRQRHAALPPRPRLTLSPAGRILPGGRWRRPRLTTSTGDATPSSGRRGPPRPTR